MARTRTRIDVVARIDGIKDDGHTYAAGEVFQMEASLVGPHEAAGLVERRSPAPAEAAKQQATPANKQVTGSKDK